MKEKRTIFIASIILILLLLFPVRQKDEEVISYKALLYKITDVSNSNEFDSKDHGFIIEILGHIIYNGIEIFPTAEEDLKTSKTKTA